MEWETLIPTNIRNKYELHNFNNAAEIMSTAFPNEWSDLCFALDHFYITNEEMKIGGGSESPIPKRIATLLRPREWNEIRVTGDLVVNLKNATKNENSTFRYNDFLYGYFIDYVKNHVAFDMEWNSKDQTFDRDLTSFRAFFETGVINVAAIMTRSEELNPVFNNLGIKQKYGASTTWMGKLLPRVRARRQDGCPLLVIGITQRCIMPDDFSDEFFLNKDPQSPMVEESTEPTEVALNNLLTQETEDDE